MFLGGEHMLRELFTCVQRADNFFHCVNGASGKGVCLAQRSCQVGVDGGWRIWRGGGLCVACTDNLVALQ